MKFPLKKIKDGRWNTVFWIVPEAIPGLKNYVKSIVLEMKKNGEI